MGAGASTLPERIDKDTAKTLAGDKWDEAAAAKFDSMAEDGTVSREQFEEAAGAGGGGGGGGDAPKKGRRRFSLVGTEHEGESLAEVAAKKRRDSVVAVETDDAVRSAPDEEKVGVLLETMKTMWAKPADETKEDEEFFSWALSCSAELSQGSEENRAKLLAGGAPELILQFMDVHPHVMHVLGIGGTPESVVLGPRAA